MTKKSSFLRQLNLYSFNRISAGPDQGSYYHEKFLRGMKFLCRRMSRQKVNGNRIRSAGNPDEEPKMAMYPACPPPSLMLGKHSVVSTMDVSTSIVPAAVLSSLAGIAAVTSSLPAKKHVSQDMTIDATTTIDHKRMIDEIPKAKGDENENDDYESSEENYRTGNTTMMPTTVEARSWGVQ
jgi:HSF-type DNA-binding